LQPNFKQNRIRDMAKICVITGKGVQRGNHVSHSNIKTKRVFNPNLQTKRFWLEEEQEWITLKLSAKGIKIINRIGVKEALKRSWEKGIIG